MKIAKAKHKNIYCIEGNWTHDLRDRRSIKTGLEFLEHNSYSKKNVLHIHRQSSSLHEFENLLKESVFKKYDKYSILYLAFHGHEGMLRVGKRSTISIDGIAEILEEKAQNKIIHFGSCETLNVKKPQLNRFLKRTGALAVSGYEKTIDFMPSTFLDLLYFQFCQQYQKMYLVEQDVKQYYGKLARELGFKMVYEK
jgi:hypothetical protein